LIARLEDASIPSGEHAAVAAKPRETRLASWNGKVLVVGATGALGRPVVHGLLERGVAVRALCRHPEQAADLAALDAEVVAGDLTDATSLARATTGVSRVLAAAHGILGRGRWRSEAVDDAGHRSLFAAARNAGVDRLVYVSAYGASPDHPIDFFRTKHAMEQALAASGLRHVVLRPTAFMEHHAHNFIGAGLLAKGKAQLIGPGTKPRNFVAAGDVALLALRALMDEPLPFGQLDIGGPGHYSNLEVAALYARCAGLPLRVSHLPAGLARVIAVPARLLHPGLARILKMSSLPDDAYSERFDGAQALQREHGLTLTPLPQFVERQVARWRQAGRA
jgi:NADH dehydrogenase